MGLEWFGRHYGENTFFFKTDTDVLIDIFRIIWFIRNFKYKWSENEYLFGNIQQGGYVRRDKRDKWFVRRKTYQNRTYPPYAIGKQF